MWDRAHSKLFKQFWLIELFLWAVVIALWARITKKNGDGACLNLLHTHSTGKRVQ